VQSNCLSIASDFWWLLLLLLLLLPPLLLPHCRD